MLLVFCATAIVFGPMYGTIDAVYHNRRNRSSLLETTQPQSTAACHNRTKHQVDAAGQSRSSHLIKKLRKARNFKENPILGHVFLHFG
ncbi:unnamed protein product [Dicrocoelium dendriticum]|nr:unnamed protein product [Dicrocoelium dendriticum]